MNSSEMPGRTFLLLTLLCLSACGPGLCLTVGKCSGIAAHIPLSVASKSLSLLAVEVIDDKVKLGWQEAVGNPGLRYSVYYSTSANIDTIESIKANGTLAGVATDAAFLQFTGLDVDTIIDQQFYYNAIVTDSTGEEIAYEMRPSFCAGTGTPADPFLICDVGSLQWMEIYSRDRATYPSAYSFEMTQAIDGSDTVSWNSGRGFVAIGDDDPATGFEYFSGEFDGQSYPISNLYIRSSYVSALIGFNEGTVRNVTIVNPDIEGDFVGGVIFEGNCWTVLQNLHVQGGIIKGDTIAGGAVGQLVTVGGVCLEDSSSSARVEATSWGGGLIGFSSQADIRRSYATGDVVAGFYAGGLVANLSGATVSDSYALGDVQSTGFNAGGITGNASSGTILRSYATGNVVAAGIAGGLIGSVNVAAIATNSWATGSVAGGGAIGGLSGDPATLTGSFWHDHAGNPATGHQGGNGGATADATGARFTGSALAPNSTWTFPTVWKFPSGGGYPILSWQN